MFGMTEFEDTKTRKSATFVNEGEMQYIYSDNPKSGEYPILTIELDHIIDMFKKSKDIVAINGYMQDRRVFYRDPIK